METRKERLFGAVARGWCSEKNENKTMDADLVEAIVNEIMLLPLDVEQEMAHLYNVCTDKQRKLDILTELHRMRAAEGFKGGN